MKTKKTKTIKVSPDTRVKSRIFRGHHIWIAEDEFPDGYKYFGFYIKKDKGEGKGE